MAGKVTEELFKNAKLMINAGMSQRQIAKILNVSQNAICHINITDTLKDYNALVAKKSQADRDKKKGIVKPAEQKEEPQKELPPQVVEYRQNVTIQATHYMMQEMQKTNELLKLISNKLAFIVEELTGKTGE